MIALQNRIQALSDADAQRIIITFAQSQPAFNNDSLTLGAPTIASPIHMGELARDTLLLLADEPQFQQVIEALVSGPSPQRFDAGFSTAVTLVAVVFLLRTNIKYERKAGGQWTFKIEHKSADSALLKALLEKLAKFLPV